MDLLRCTRECVGVFRVCVCVCVWSAANISTNPLWCGLKVQWMIVGTTFVVIHNLSPLRTLSKAFFFFFFYVDFHHSVISRCARSRRPKCTMRYLSASVYTCLCVRVCVNAGIMIDWQWERQHHPKQAEKPYIPGLRAVNLSTDYKLKHAARSHHCFSKYFQS